MAQKFRLELAAVLWRFLHRHEDCLADAIGVSSFDLVTTVPSRSPERDANHPLHTIVGEVVDITCQRYERLLTAADVSETDHRSVELARFDHSIASAPSSVLLIDDTWTTGANAQSAAGILKSAGVAHVGVVIIGRHVHEEYGSNRERLRAIPRPFNWETCALEADY